MFERESHLSLLTRKVRTFFRNITLEPVMLFYGVIRSLDSIASGQLLIDKTCENDFNFPDYICSNLTDYSVNNTNVQNEVAQFKVLYFNISS